MRYPLRRSSCFVFACLIVAVTTLFSVEFSDYPRPSAQRLQPKYAPVRLASGEVKIIEYTTENKMAILEGDIILGPADRFETAYKAYLSDTADKNRQALVINGPRFRWPNFQIPFVIDANSLGAAVADVQAAINTWNNLLRPLIGNRDAWIARRTEAQFVTFVRRPQDRCTSFIGRQPTPQEIVLPQGCGPGRIMHEMGHAMGLWHEHSRVDRDRFVTINYSNIPLQFRSEFDQHIHDGGIVGPYDYGSIMHYDAFAFAIDPNQPTIISPQPIGQRNAPSPGDVQGVMANFEQAGWAVRICDGTQANAINFRVGSVRNGTRRSRFWFSWGVGMRKDFPFPPDLLFDQRIWIRGEPWHKQTNLCIVYNQAPKQFMTFDDDEDKEVAQDESANCRCL
jgi:Astacin (Peptidase family M12A)